RLHTRGAIWLLDLEATGGEEILPGLRCLPAGGHTEGSMVIVAETDEDAAVFCGDLVYSVRHQLMNDPVTVNDPGLSANYVVTRRGEKAAMKRLLGIAPRFRLFPSHDWPVVIDHGKVAQGADRCVARVDSACWCKQTELGYKETAGEAAPTATGSR
ncbi:MAG: hypothetical protein V4787_16875, partial [Pseudomonadota bacterium]